MIKIQCSKLEQIRINPVAYVQGVKTSENGDGGGSYGMFACWQTKIRNVHTGEMNPAEAFKSLQQRFLSYKDSQKNKKKQEFLYERFDPYLNEFNKKGFQYIGSKRQVRWPLTKGVELTGHTPYVFSKSKGFAAYFFTEAPMKWETELRFPLLQYYLAKNHLDCTTDELEIGTYCLETNGFSLKCYSEEDIEEAVEETTGIFEIIAKEFGSR